MSSSTQTLTTKTNIQSNGVLRAREAWGDRPYIAAGGMTTADKLVEKYGGLAAFGRHFVANVSRVFVGWWSQFSKQTVARPPFTPEGRRSLTDAL